MLANSFFASSALVERDVTLGGEVHKLHFRQLTAVEYRKAWASVDGEMAVIGLIVATLCEADGTPAITLEQGLTLTPVAARSLGEAALSVNGLGDLGNA